MFALIYAHVGYPLSSTCLNPLKGKIPVESVLRVDIGNRDSEYITPYLYHKNEEVQKMCEGIFSMEVFFKLHKNAKKNNL